MAILVVNCFNWVGYHIVNDFLNKGYRVEGIELKPSKKSEHLAMFFSRNSLFKTTTIQELNQSYSAIILNSYGISNADKTLSELTSFIKHKFKKEQSVTKVIDYSLIYGEWMPMDLEGMYYLNHYIHFKSDLFSNEAVYIKEFVNRLLSVIKESKIKQEMFITFKQTNVLSEQILEKSQSIRDNVPKECKLNDVLLHYQRYKEYY